MLPASAAALCARCLLGRPNGRHQRGRGGSGCIYEAFPGLGYASAIFGVYLVFDQLTTTSEFDGRMHGGRQSRSEIFVQVDQVLSRLLVFLRYFRLGNRVFFVVCLLMG